MHSRKNYDLDAQIRHRYRRHFQRIFKPNCRNSIEKSGLRTDYEYLFGVITDACPGRGRMFFLPPLLLAGFAGHGRLYHNLSKVILFAWFTARGMTQTDRGV